MSKKELKDYVNANGFFTSAMIQREVNAPSALKDQIPEGAIYFKAIASNGELNRNGYIIRESAWKPAIAGYMENPIVLLQHDMDQPVGHVLTARVGKEGLVIEGYVYDEHTDGRFGKNLFNAISTGHLTEEIEFENTATGQILSEEEFRALPWEEKISEQWVMAVTALDWLENSIVSIGANRKSMILGKDLVKNYVEAMRKNDVEDEEDIEDEGDEFEDEEETLATRKVEKAEVEEEEGAEDEKDGAGDEEEGAEEAPEEEEEIEEEAPEEGAPTETIETPGEGGEEDETGKVEIPPADTPGGETNALKVPESETLTLTKEEVKQFNGIVSGLINALEAEKAKTTALKATLNSIPKPKGFVIANLPGHAGSAPKKESALQTILQANGIKLNTH